MKFEPLTFVCTSDIAGKSLLSFAELAGRSLRRLVRGWFRDGFADIYIDHKRNEIETVQSLDDTSLCAACVEVY